MSTETTAPAEIECAWKDCTTTFTPRSRAQVYCSKEHQLAASRLRQRERNLSQGLTGDGKPRQRRRTAVTHEWVAARTGYSKSGIGRMRDKGNRDAVINMERFNQMNIAFGWSVEDQITAAAAGRWADEFEKVIADAYAKENSRG